MNTLKYMFEYKGSVMQTYALEKTYGIQIEHPSGK
jgi:hypothetical protein